MTWELKLRMSRVNIAPKYAYPKIIAKKCFMIISCTFRHSEQHIKCLTEMEHGKVKMYDIKKWPKSVPDFT